MKMVNTANQKQQGGLSSSNTFTIHLSISASVKYHVVLSLPPFLSDVSYQALLDERCLVYLPADILV